MKLKSMCENMFIKVLFKIKNRWYTYPCYIVESDFTSKTYIPAENVSNIKIPKLITNDIRRDFK